jgi:hypothetical protein
MFSERKIAMTCEVNGRVFELRDMTPEQFEKVRHMTMRQMEEYSDVTQEQFEEFCYIWRLSAPRFSAVGLIEAKYYAKRHGLDLTELADE